MIDTVKLAYVVPTKDRPDDLAKLLDSINQQTRMPVQIVVVDGSEPAIKHVTDKYPQLPITYVREVPPSLTRQRNAGMAALHDDVTIAGYLDDDIVLEDDATEQMISFWESAGPDIGGAAFTIVNQFAPHHESILRIFAIESRTPGVVLSSGFAAAIPCVPTTIETDWLYGGATMWRRNVIDTITYDEWYEGYGYLEDLDYSYRVKQNWRLFVLAEAKAWHYPRNIAIDKQYEFGRQQVFNRFYFIRKMGLFSPITFSWALIGVFMMNFLALLRHFDPPRIRRLKGNFRGLFAAIAGRRETFPGHWK
ncbi:MAG: glycosyltransferase [Rhodospirillales bacterium]